MFGIGLMILLAQPAFAEELGQANITPRTKMAEIRSNPSVVGAGIYTYSLDQDRVLDRMYWDAQPLSRLSNHWTAQDAADGLNYLIRTYNAGQRVTFPLYTAEEIAQDTSRDGVELYYLPAEGAQANQKYALVIGGNAIVVSAEIREGISTAWNLHEMGYPVFVLRYRIGMKASNNAPLQDVVIEHFQRRDLTQAEDRGGEDESAPVWLHTIVVGFNGKETHWDKIVDGEVTTRHDQALQRITFSYEPSTGALSMASAWVCLAVFGLMSNAGDSLQPDGSRIRASFSVTFRRNG